MPRLDRHLLGDRRALHQRLVEIAADRRERRARRASTRSSHGARSRRHGPRSSRFRSSCRAPGCALDDPGGAAADRRRRAGTGSPRRRPGGPSRPRRPARRPGSRIGTSGRAPAARARSEGGGKESMQDRRMTGKNSLRRRGPTPKTGASRTLARQAGAAKTAAGILESDRGSPYHPAPERRRTSCARRPAPANRTWPLETHRVYHRPHSWWRLRSLVALRARKLAVFGVRSSRGIRFATQMVFERWARAGAPPWRTTRATDKEC